MTNNTVHNQHFGPKHPGAVKGGTEEDEVEDNKLIHLIVDDTHDSNKNKQNKRKGVNESRLHCMGLVKKVGGLDRGTGRLQVQ